MVYKRATNAREVLPKKIDIATTLMQENAFAFIVIMLAPALRSSSFIIAHTRKRLAFIVALAFAPALHSLHSSSFIVAHARKRLALIHALILEKVLRSSSLIVAQARHSSTLKLENALRSCLQQPCTLVPHRRTSALMLSCVLRSSMLLCSC